MPNGRKPLNADPLEDTGEWMSEAVDKALSAADERLRDWNLRCKTWYVVHYTVGVSGILLNAAIAGFAKLEATNLDWLFWIAIIAAVLQGFTTFFGARKKAAAYRAGWRTLWVARERLESGVETDPRKVFDAIEKGWRQLNEGDAEA